ncbi:hypothetical protein IWX90DRAFT_417468 [Phyllosticta citrichinensis]|uniref:Phosphatidate cytidylyltransferase n=1 Tax=Phyllosticta citrichinensis TaxID=1130410 RepID=A0ABR1XL23_9PEZI
MAEAEEEEEEEEARNKSTGDRTEPSEPGWARLPSQRSQPPVEKPSPSVSQHRNHPQHEQHSRRPPSSTVSLRQNSTLAASATRHEPEHAQAPRAPNPKSSHTPPLHPGEARDLSEETLLQLRGRQPSTDFYSVLAALCSNARSTLHGHLRSPLLPPFSLCWYPAMAVSAQAQVPRTPRVISPSPTPSESNMPSSGYFTRSAARRVPTGQPPPTPPINELDDQSSSGSDELGRRPRARSRSPMKKRPVVKPLTKQDGAVPTEPRNKDSLAAPNGHSSGHLSPTDAQSNKEYWRSLSRSPSPLGLIPIHQEWRSFIHRHEIPRKILHTSIGFLTLGLYTSATQPTSIHPILFGLLIPIATVDFLRHRFNSLNRFYIRCLGALMRESEVDGWNGVIWYLLGTWTALRWFPKDVGVMAVLLLSWCDTAASTAGRRWGKYTPQIRRGKSLAGSLAALLTGVVTASLFYGWIAPRVQAGEPGVDSGDFAFAFQGRLGLPAAVKGALGLGEEQGSIGGGLALGAMSLVSGVVASASEAVDIFGWDDNVTIPVLCACGLWGFLKIFGSA